MPTMQFPRTMTKGVLKGQTFRSQADYNSALKAARNGHRKGTPHFMLRVEVGAMVLEVQGDPTSESDIDALLKALTAFPNGDGSD